jgi:twinkle protein
MELFQKDENFYITGWNSFDNLAKIRLGYLMVVSGYPSRGKSYFVNNMLVNLSKKYDIKHLIASFEDTIGSLYTTLFQIYVGKTINKIKYESGENAFEKVLCSDEYEFINEHFKFFENDRTWSIDEIIKRTEIEYIKHGIKVLVIDPYNRLQNEYRDREDKYIGSILAKLCTLAKRLNILVVFVAHPKKPAPGEANNPPNLYDISGSGDWYNMSDYGIIVHRKRKEDGKLEDIVQVDIQKIKNFSLGDPKGGCITLRFDKPTMNIVDF